MSQLNPYDSFLDGRPVDAILASTADAIAESLKAIGPNRIDNPPAPGKWSAAEIACHLADCELVFGFRLAAGNAGIGRGPLILIEGLDGGPRPMPAFPAARRLMCSPRCAGGICG